MVSKAPRSPLGASILALTGLLSDLPSFQTISGVGVRVWQWHVDADAGSCGRRRRRLDAWRRREARGSYAVVAFRLRLICAPSTGHRRGTESLQRSEGRVRLEHIHMRDPPLLFLLFLLVCYLLYNGHARRRRRRHGRGSYNLNFFRASSRPTGHGPGRQSCMPQPYIYACLSIMPKSNRSQLMSRLEKSE